MKKKAFNLRERQPNKELGARFMKFKANNTLERVFDSLALNPTASYAENPALARVESQMNHHQGKNTKSSNPGSLMSHYNKSNNENTFNSQRGSPANRSSRDFNISKRVYKDISRGRISPKALLLPELH